MVKRDNHYVPQMYLKRWATEKKLWVYTLLVPHDNFPTWDFRSVKGLAYLENLYVRVCGAEELDDFEVDFDSRFENPASSLLEKLSNGERLLSVEWKTISEYIAAQYVRTPAFYNTLKSFMPKIVDDAISDIGAKLSVMKEPPHSVHSKDPSDELLPLKFTVTDQKVSETQTLARIDAIVGKSMWLFAIQRELRTGSAMLDAMREMKWSIVTAPENCSWPTSDNPVAVVHIKSNGQLERSRGIQQGNAMVVFPVSPRKLLIGKPRNRLPYTFQADLPFYHQLKRVILNNAFLQVYSVEKDDEIVDLRRRTVDCKSFNRIHKEFDTWYDSYKVSEVPMLHPHSIDR